MVQRKKREKYLFLQLLANLWKIIMRLKIRKTGVYGWELTMNGQLLLLPVPILGPGKAQSERGVITVHE